MPRMPKWFRELEKSERQKLNETEKTLYENLQLECDFFEYSPNVSLNLKHKPKTKGDYRWTVEFFGLKEEEVLALIESLERCRDEIVGCHVEN